MTLCTNLEESGNKIKAPFFFNLILSGNSHIVEGLLYMSQLLLLGKFEYGGGPIFKVVLEC